MRQKSNSVFTFMNIQITKIALFKTTSLYNCRSIKSVSSHKWAYSRIVNNFSFSIPHFHNAQISPPMKKYTSNGDQQPKVEIDFSSKKSIFSNLSKTLLFFILSGSKIRLVLWKILGLAIRC